MKSFRTYTGGKDIHKMFYLALSIMKLSLKGKLCQKHPLATHGRTEGREGQADKTITIKSLISRGRYRLKLRHFCGSSSGLVPYPPSVSIPNLKA